MPIRFACHHCGQHYEVGDEYAGQATPCLACQSPLVVPPATRPRLPPPPLRQTPRRDGANGVALVLAVGLVLTLLGAVGATLLLFQQPDAGQPPPTPAQQQAAQAPPSPPPAAAVEQPPPPPVDDRPAPPPAVQVKPTRTPRLAPPSGKPWVGHSARLLHLAFTRDHLHLASAAGGGSGDAPPDDTTVRLWNALDGLEQRREWLADGAAAVAVSPDGRLAAVAPSSGTAGAGGDIHIHDLLLSRHLRTLKGHTAPVACLAFTADGKRLLGGSKSELILWDHATGRMAWRRQGLTSAPTQAVVAPDGKRALSCDGAGPGRLWDLENGEELRALGADGVRAVALSPDGRSALTASADGVRLWEVATGQEVRRYTGAGSAIHSVNISPNNRQFVAGDESGAVLQFDLDTSAPVKRLGEHGRAVCAVAFFADARRAVTGDVDGGLRVWELRLDLADLLADLKKGTLARQRAVVAELAARPDDARRALAALLAALNVADDELRAAALRLLQRRGKPTREHVAALTALVGKITFPDGQRYALEVLPGLGDDARPAVKAVLAACGDDALRPLALKALAALVRTTDTEPVTPLLRLLRDERKEANRKAALAVLANLAPPGAAHLDLLATLLQSEADEVARFALAAVGALGPAANRLADDVGAVARKSPSAERRREALATLGKLAPATGDTVKAATASMGDASADVVRQAASLLAGAGDVPGLIRALGHEDAAVRKAADAGLQKAKLERTHAKALAGLLPCKDAAVRKRGLDCLARLGPDAEAAVPALCKLLKAAPPADERLLALAALQKIGKGAASAGATLEGLVKGADLDLLLELCQTLARVEAKELPTALRRAIAELKPASLMDGQDEEAEARRERVRKALAAVGKPAVAPLVSALEKEFAIGTRRSLVGHLNGLARLQVIKALAAMEKDARSPDVLRALGVVQRTDAFPELRTAAAQARGILERKD